ncbi:MAG: hypothetical protein H8E86_02665 [Planctomycetes bacterium]|nr:hypothetical protein [Planctomycetota bacterium]
MKQIFTLLLIATLTACGGQEENNVQPAAVSLELPSLFFTETRPNDVKDLVEVKKTAKKGDEVTFLARIGGRGNASFVKTVSMMIVADPSLISCELMGEEEHCATPEDYCCEDPVLRAQGLGTIRFMNERGESYPFSIEGSHGLETLKYVVVAGNVVDINESGVFVVDASKVWVGGKPSFGNNRQGSTE